MKGNRYLVWLEWPEKCFRIDAAALRFLRDLAPAGSSVARVRSERAFLRELPGATHALTWHFREEWFALAPQLRVLATPAAGREFLPKAAPSGVTVHFGGFHGEIISESVLGFILAWAHGLFATGPMWPRSVRADAHRMLAGTKSVILGYGRIGRAIGVRLGAHGVRVVGITRKNAASLRGEVRTADWLVVALPSDTGTDSLVGAKLISSLPRKCVVVNVGRGNAVDEKSLLDALRARRVAGAYLDVFRHEPTVLNPKIRGVADEADLANLPASRLPDNLIRTPHASCFTPDYMIRFLKELDACGLLK